MTDTATGDEVRDGKAGRWWRWTLAVVLLGSLAGAGVWGTAWLLAPDHLPLERVRIDGDIRHTRQELLRNAVAERLNGGFFSLDLDAVRRAVESLPWVTQVSVRRVWPSTLVIKVLERSALARWDSGAVVSPEGEVFVPDPGSLPDGLPRFDGPEGSAAEMVEHYRWMRSRIGAWGLDIARLRLSDRHAWSLVLNNGVQVDLGNGDLERRFDRFLTQLPALQQRGEPERVDLRYTHGFAVRWRAGPEDEEQQTGAEG